MISKIDLDFETYSELELKSVGIYRYAQHTSTDILCFAYSINEGRSKIWVPGMIYPQDLIEVIKSENYIFKAHNIEFEFLIWNSILHKRWNFPALEFSKCECSAAKAAALALPRKLEHVAKALDLKQTKDMEGHRIMLKLSRSKKDGTRYTFEDTPNDFIKLYSYCLQDVAVEIEVNKNLRNLSDSEKEVFQIDHDINRFGIPMDRESIQTSIKFAEKYSLELTQELKEITRNTIYSIGQVEKIVAYINHRINFTMEDLSAKTVKDVLKRDDLHVSIRRILEIRQALGKSSVKKLNAMMDMINDDNRIRGTMLYHGSSTGRWASRGVQFQNFPRATIKENEVDQAFELIKQADYSAFKKQFPNVMNTLSSCLRGMIKAPLGYKISACDFNAIECRVLFWLARCETGLKLYRNKADIYCYMASQIYGRTINKKDHPNERFLGKSATLGCGFGLGAKKFKLSCEAQGQIISESLADKAVKSYRETFCEVPKFWYELNSAIIGAIKSQGQEFKVGHITFKVIGRFLFAKLPSGRKIAYYKPCLKFTTTPWGEQKLLVHAYGIDSKTKQIILEPITGQKMSENVTQAVARDLMVEAIKRLRKKNYSIMMTVHDEIVLLDKEDFGSVEDIESIMNEAPEWAIGLPISSEGWYGKRYRK